MTDNLGGVGNTQVRRTLGQFTPSYWDKDEWNALQGPRRFVQVLGLGVVILVVEVMGFFLKYILWVPPLNPLITYRLAIWWLIANPAIREYNVFLQTRSVRPSVSHYAGLTGGGVISSLAIIFALPASHVQVAQLYPSLSLKPLIHGFRWLKFSSNVLWTW